MLRLVVRSFAVVALSGCPGDGVATSGASGSSGSDTATATAGSSSGSISASETGTPPTGTPTTSETGDPVDETSVADSSGSPTTGTASTASSTGPEALCGPPCDAPWVHRGDLNIDDRTDLASLRCLVEVTGQLELSQLIGAPPAELANLRRIGGDLEIGWEHEMTSLAGLECLEFIGGTLSLPMNTMLADISALAGVEHMFALRMWGSPLVTDLSLFDGVTGLHWIELLDMSGVPRLPIPGPDTSLWELRLEGCHALTDLDALAGVTAGPMGFGALVIDAPKLKSVAGLAGMGGQYFGLQLVSLPALTSLAGLEALAASEDGGLYLRDLPQVPDLEPLAGVEHLTSLYLDGMPKVKTLAPLAGLRTVGDLTLGSCSDEHKGTGLDGLTTLDPLEKLEGLTWLNIARNDALTELPQFSALKFDIGGATVIDNPKVPAPSIAAFMSEHPGCAQPPMECSCPEDLPNP